jgi:general secretion pathway protein C
MKRLPLLAVFILFLALCMSTAYWGMQLFKPPVRNVAPATFIARSDAPLVAATGLFGGGGMAVAAASNFVLTGVVVAGNGRESMAIISVDGKPGKAVAMNGELQPGVVIREVHPQFILLSDGGVSRRIELPKSSSLRSEVATYAPVPVAPPGQRLPPEMSNATNPAMQPQPPLPIPPVQPTMPGPTPRPN